MPGEQSRINGRKNKNQGRPKATATIIAQEFRKALALQIESEMQEWIDPIKDAAFGHWFEGKEGKIYKKSPDPQAWDKAMNRAFGKPKETHEIIGDAENPVRILTVKPIEPESDEDEE